MKQYEIVIFSNIIASLSSLILTLGCSYLLTFLPNDLNKLLVFMIVSSLFTLAYMLVRLISSGKIEIELTDKGFAHKWTSKFLFSKEKNIELNWQEIIDYEFGGWSLYKFFQINLINNRKYRIYRWADFEAKDGFKKFARGFQSYFKHVKHVP